MVETSARSFFPADEHFLETLYNAFTETVIGIDPSSGRILHWNKAAAAMFAQSAQDVAGKTIEVIDADERSFQSFLSEVRKQGKGETQWQVRRSDGVSFTVELTGTLVRQPALDGEYVVLVLREPSLTQARLFEIVRERTKLIQLLQEIAVVANEASSIDDALEVTIDKICRKTSFPGG